MIWRLDTIKPAPKSKTARQRLGRGDASKGSFSGRGVKGQRARSGGKGGLKERAWREQFFSKTPKVKGFKRQSPPVTVINLALLEQEFSADSVVTLDSLRAAGLVSKNIDQVKILAQGKLTKKLEVKVAAASKEAIKAIKAAGGEFKVTHK